jgi:hypothetical protein
MFLILSAAFGAAYDCPEVNVPSEARNLYPGDLKGLFDQIEVWANDNWDASCIADCEDPGDFDICKVADCVTPGGVAFSFSVTEHTEENTTFTTTTIEMDPVDEIVEEPLSWDSFYFRRELTDELILLTGDTRVTTRWESSWDGELPDLPKDFQGVATHENRETHETGSTSESREFSQDGGCYWRWTHDVYAGEELAFYEIFEEWSLQTYATEQFEVKHHFGSCDAEYGGVVVASLNFDYLGQVDPVTWAFMGADDDDDGWSIEGGDRDDTDGFNVPCDEVEVEEEEEEEETPDVNNRLCGLVGTAGLVPLSLALVAVSRRRW